MLPSISSHRQVIQPLLTDFDQFQMVYSYWLHGKTNDYAVFDLYLQKNPFKGEYTVFAGLADCINYVHKFNLTENDIDYIRSTMPPSTKHDFFEFLRTATTEAVTLYCIPEGYVVFPKIPVMRIEGPLGIVTLLETTIINLVNFASLVTTNAARFRKAAGDQKILLEFGLRRAQGPDGGLSASKYCYIGGFDGTSNVLAGKEYGIPVKGTHAHAFVSSFQPNEVISPMLLQNRISNQMEDLSPTVYECLEEIPSILKKHVHNTNRGELLAFISYAVAYPTSFVALVDTYDTLKSGVINFIAVALALHQFGYSAQGIRIDSGDLAYLSREIRSLFKMVAENYDLLWFSNLTITASNNINEDTLNSLYKQGHSIDAFGIGTHLVTCQKEPALGFIFQLVEINGDPRMTTSKELEKISIPGKKNAYRLYGCDGLALLDLMTRYEEDIPLAQEKMLCRHVINGAKRAYVKPSRVETLLKLYLRHGNIQSKIGSLEDARSNVTHSISNLRKDHVRALNPTPYKVSVTNELYQFMHYFWLESAPTSELQ